MTIRPRYRRLAVALVALAAPVVAACGSTDDTPEYECLEVPSAVTERIAMPAMAANPAVPITITDAAAIKAIDNYYIAAQFTAPGGVDETGVWATASIEGSGAQIYSTEGFSHEFTRWPEAPGINGANQYVLAAKSCL